MSIGFDIAELDSAVRIHGAIARILIASHAGSSPRETGTSMLVWDQAFEGTIGGGALEFEAIRHARALLENGGEAQILKMPLGPTLGQCCGGSVTLVIECIDADKLAAIDPDQPYLRAIDVTAADATPLALTKLVKMGRVAQCELQGGWLVEPMAAKNRQLWLYGAGHVGRAIVEVLHGLPFDITWVDTDLSRFPDPIPANASPLVAPDPAQLVKYAPDDAEHLVLTYSHAFDLDICHQVLSRTFGTLGVIGSDTKKVRFRNRLKALGHKPELIDRMNCPIGQRSLGKLPKAIAVGIAADLMENVTSQIEAEEGEFHG